ncbi:MAG TPA: tetratricopeptide repeat protein [Thermoanaerobaculia bacterium]|nr:tetratricopeptide repeat protein [Thermoanaerobaculia bacterium]
MRPASRRPAVGGVDRRWCRCAVALWVATMCAGAPALGQSAAEHRRLATQHLREGRDAQAEPHLRALVEDAGSVAARLQLARLHARRGEPAAGLDVLVAAIPEAPSSEELLITFAELALAARAPERAVLALEPLARMSPSVARYPYLIGVARMQLGDLAGAVEALERAARLEPEHALTHVALGLLYNREKRYELAREALERALRLQPGDLDALAALAESAEGLDQLELAERHATLVLAQRPEHSTANLVLGMVRMKQGRFEEARDALVRAVAAEPDSPKGHYQLGLAYARLGDADASRRHLDAYREATAAIERRAQARVGTSLAGAAEEPQ